MYNFKYFKWVSHIKIVTKEEIICREQTSFEISALNLEKSVGTDSFFKQTAIRGAAS